MRFQSKEDNHGTLAHYKGDRLLKQITVRLSGVIRESDTLARIGGDEFGFILPKLRGRSDLEKIAKKIKKSLTGTFALENLSFEVQASIGAPLFPDHGKDAHTLIQRANVAMQTLAEHTGLIEPLTLWVIKSALSQGAICHKEYRAIAIAVNVSALSLLNPELSEEITGLLTAFNFRAVSITTWVFRA